jgi:hypothetical protein
MIENIALAAAAALVPAIAVFTWIVKKRIDELQDEIFLLTDEIRALRHQAKNPEYYKMARQYPKFNENAIAPKDFILSTREKQLERVKQKIYAEMYSPEYYSLIRFSQRPISSALNNVLRKAGEK